MRCEATISHLLGEFAALNEARRTVPGKLPPPSEKRWVELKAFYDEVMCHNGLSPARPYLAYRHQVPRERVRVPSALDFRVRHAGEYFTARALNLNRVGLFLASRRLLEVGARVELFLVHSTRGPEPVFEAEGEVVWLTESGVGWAALPRGMGVRFLRFPQAMEEKLDQLVVENLEKRFAIH
jgi:uncharacterized protein (TIGR02266 family)